MTLTATGGTLGTNAIWKWYTNTAKGRIMLTNGSQIKVAYRTTTTYYVRAEGTCNSTTAINTTITSNAPTITQQPYSTDPCGYGQKFNVDAVGVGSNNSLSYQWYNENGIINDVYMGFSGTTTNSFWIYNTPNNYNHTYYCIIKSRNTGCQIQSSGYTTFDCP